MASPPTILDRKRQYRKLKSKLKNHVYVNELLQEELKIYQKSLLKINQDKYFLFERLLLHEKPQPEPKSLPDPPQSSRIDPPQRTDPPSRDSDSDRTDSDAELEISMSPQRKPMKRSLIDPNVGGMSPSLTSTPLGSGIVFSSGFSKSKAMPSLKRTHRHKKMNSSQNADGSNSNLSIDDNVSQSSSDYFQTHSFSSTLPRDIFEGDTRTDEDSM